VRGRAGGQGLGLLLPLLLLAPPAVNLLRESRRASGAAPAADPSAPTRDLQLDSLRQLLAEKDRELERVRGYAQSQPRYFPVLAHTVPLVSDPSPARSALWLWGTGLESASAGAPAAYRGALIGRVERVWPERGLARLQTLRDEYFRVRFRWREVRGFLGGMGKTDAQGRPLLEIQHLSVEAAFREGERVFTDGDDGLYPRDLPIGTLVRSELDGSGGERFLVRAEWAPERVPEVVILIDRAALEARALAGRGDGQ
jgi:cell shape-determining protein MreC